MGTATIKARAVDDSGNIQPAAAQVDGRSRTAVVPMLDLGRQPHRAPADADSNAVELGLKFRSDTDGFITGVRFYKTAENIRPP